MAVCLPLPVFERDVAQIGDYYLRKAMRRKSLGFTVTGIELLQRTHADSRDLEYAEPLRRSLNKSLRRLQLMVEQRRCTRELLMV